MSSFYRKEINCMQFWIIPDQNPANHCDLVSCNEKKIFSGYVSHVRL